MFKRAEIVKPRLLKSAYTELINDEKLLRLLFYPADTNPLDKELPNIKDKPEYEMWKIINKHILTSSKSRDLEEERICRLYLYTGRTGRSRRSMFTTRQEIVIDVFCHIDYERDARSGQIDSRLSELLFRKHLDGGIGEVDYGAGYEIAAPRDYEAYRHIYEIGGTK